jgi:glycosyltransferase involved in cell wall biosynthesis
VSLARQTGLGAATGAYVQYLDSDDLLHPDKLRTQVNALLAGGADVAYGDWEKFQADASGATVILERNARRIEDRPEIATFTDFWCPPAALLYSKRITETIGPWNRSLPIIQDARYLWDAANAKAKFVYTPGIMAQYRVSEGQSLSTRFGNLRFTADVFENARQVYGHWRPDLAGDPEKKAALLKVLFQCARGFYEHDKRQFEECLRLLREIGGKNFIPTRPVLLKTLSTLLGYRQGRIRCASVPEV